MPPELTIQSRQFTPILLLSVSCWLLAPSFANAYTFSRDLKLGDSGEDVRALQISLNADIQTRIAVSGDGSPGYETAFFGEKTQSAVIRYQNIYKNEVLTPLGLTSGTGYVGSATRKQLEKTTNGIVSPIVEQKSTTDLLAAFDAALGTSQVETNRSPVDDPSIPSTQEELFAMIHDFAGAEASEQEIQDFSRTMVLARYGYASNTTEQELGSNREVADASSRQAAESGESSGSGAGCIAILLDILGL